MQKEIINVYKNRIEYLTECNNSFMRRLNIINAQIIIHSEDMIIKNIMILKGKSKNIEGIIENFIAKNFYNYKAMLFHYEIIHLNEKESSLILYCINYNPVLYELLQNYRKYNILPIQSLVAKYVINKVSKDRLKIVFYKDKITVMFLIIAGNCLIYTSNIKDFKEVNINNHIDEGIVEAKNILPMILNIKTLILINFNTENPLPRDAYKEEIEEVISIELSERELIKEHGKRKI